MTDPKLVLAQFVGEIQADLIPAADENLSPPTRCEVCGATSHAVEQRPAICELRHKLLDCPRRDCGGRAVAIDAVVKTSEGLPCQRRDIIKTYCTGCGGDGLSDRASGPVERAEPFAVDSYDVEIDHVVWTEIHQHHVSYADNETIPVCSSCHGKIHHDDSFRPDLLPDMSRSEWMNSQQTDAQKS